MILQETNQYPYWLTFGVKQEIKFPPISINRFRIKTKHNNQLISELVKILGRNYFQDGITS